MGSCAGHELSVEAEQRRGRERVAAAKAEAAAERGKAEAKMLRAHHADMAKIAAERSQVAKQHDQEVDKHDVSDLTQLRESASGVRTQCEQFENCIAEMLPMLRLTCAAVPVAMPTGSVEVLMVPKTASFMRLLTLVEQLGGPSPFRQQWELQFRCTVAHGITHAASPIASMGLSRLTSHGSPTEKAAAVVTRAVYEPCLCAPLVSVSEDRATAILYCGIREFCLTEPRIPTPLYHCVTAFAGYGFHIGIKEGRRLQVFGVGEAAERIRQDMRRQRIELAMYCAVHGKSVAFVTPTGCLLLCGPIRDRLKVPDWLQGSVLSAAIGPSMFVAVLNDHTTACYGMEMDDGQVMKLPGPVARMSAGEQHVVLILENMQVVTRGDVSAQAGQTAISCASGDNFAVLVEPEGTLRWLGTPPAGVTEKFEGAGPFAWVGAGGSRVVAITARGYLVSSTEHSPPPQKIIAF